VLYKCKFDKVKPVREATIEAIKLLKEIGPQIDEADLAPDLTTAEKGSRSKSPSFSSVSKLGEGQRAKTPDKTGLSPVPRNGPLRSSKQG